MMGITERVKRLILLPEVRAALENDDDLAFSEALHWALRNRRRVKEHYDWSYRRMTALMSRVPGLNVELGGRPERV